MIWLLKIIHSHHSEVIYFLLFLVNEAFDMALSAIIIAAIVTIGIVLRYLLRRYRDFILKRERRSAPPTRPRPSDRAHVPSGDNFQEGACDPTLGKKSALYARADSAEGLLCKRRFDCCLKVQIKIPR